MHRLPFSGIAVCLFLSSLMCEAQLSPEILTDQRATFRFQSADAEEVIAAGSFGDDLPLAKGEKGLWEGTTPGPVAAGVHEYGFKVDGMRMLDPRNREVKPQRWPNTSILHVSASPPALWDWQDIPHGTVHQHSYRSKALDGATRNVMVYTPPKSEAKGPLPVLYLAHGYSDQEQTWTVHGKAHWILDALLAQEQAVPMIIVMPDAHALAPETQDASDFKIYGPKNSAAFCQELVQDVIPLIDSTYQTRQDAKGRAFAGLSMGGHHALTVALQHHDTFSQIGAFSSAIPPPVKGG